MSVHDLGDRPVHLGLGASATVEPQFTGALDWYMAYEARHAGDGIEGRLVSMHTFSEPWTSWEMHPHGAEVVLCVSGAMTVHQERPGEGPTMVRLGPGQYVVNEPGVWHTADVEGEATAVFITAGAGTQHRARHPRWPRLRGATARRRGSCGRRRRSAGVTRRARRAPRASSGRRPCPRARGTRTPPRARERRPS
ncbi:MAG: cupin domain-containing protein [Deltaproteobacteria bacterium]|nr:cupin domain-containing protein [Deltaproteobacteria bacterium]